MNKHVLNILCGVIMVISGVVIIHSVIKYNKKPTRVNPANEIIREEGELYPDPLTEVEFDEKLHDFGILPKDTVVFKTYTLKNIGENPLVIYLINPDCNCTDYELSKKIAIPGDSIQIKLQVDTKGKEKKFMVNTVVRVNTQLQMYRLRLTGEIRSK